MRLSPYSSETYTTVFLPISEVLLTRFADFLRNLNTLNSYINMVYVPVSNILRSPVHLLSFKRYGHILFSGNTFKRLVVYTAFARKQIRHQSLSKRSRCYKIFTDPTVYKHLLGAYQEDFLGFTIQPVLLAQALLDATIKHEGTVIDPFSYFYKHEGKWRIGIFHQSNY